MSRLPIQHYNLSLYQRILEDGFEVLPDAVKRAHAFKKKHVLEGKVDIDGSRTFLGKCLIRLLGLPRSGKGLPARVTIYQEDLGERWERKFGSGGFSSHVTAHDYRPDCIVETRGMVSADIRLHPVPEGLRWEVESFRLFGFALPPALAPATQALERDVDGIYHFEMSMTLPLLGDFIAYRGWLIPEKDLMEIARNRPI
jgi:hypothetical protein